MELDGFRILHLSDFHMRPSWLAVYDQIIDRVALNPPDLVVITGDFVENKVDPRPSFPFIERFLTQLQSLFGIAAVLGNHDGHLLGPHLARWNVRFVDNQLIGVRVGAAVVELIGLEGVVRQDLNVDRLAKFPDKPAGALRIALSHYPDAVLRTGDVKPDLFLAGHTHGGQVCLPGGIPIITHDSLPRRYGSGIHRFGDTWLVVNRGLGFAGIPLRLFCPAEIIEIKVLSDER
jgi:predicted MPP superfamily phosphohydrolase